MAVIFIFEDLNPHVQYFVRKQCSPQWMLSDSTVPFCDLTFVEKGKAVYHTNQKSMIIREGEAVFLPANSFRCAETSGMICTAFNFTLDTGEALSLENQFKWHLDPTLLSYFSDFEREWLQRKPGWMLKCKGIFLLILCRAQQMPMMDKNNMYVHQIMDYISRHYIRQITVREIAIDIGLSPVYCGSLFKKATGMSILEYANHLKINKAASLLEYGGSTIAETAAQTGFTDVFYFSRIFKEIMGLSPSQYAKKQSFPDRDHHTYMKEI